MPKIGRSPVSVVQLTDDPLMDLNLKEIPVTSLKMERKLQKGEKGKTICKTFSKINAGIRGDRLSRR